MITHSKIRIAALVMMTLAWSVSAFAQVAGDATGRGPLPTTRADYRFPASVDPDIISGRATEIWARVYMPRDFSGVPFGLIIFLHGNHGTCGTGASPRNDNSCQYTTTGSCPPGYVVTPNHLGYAYLAERLASWGYLVVSINANRGITCGAPAPGDGGLNLARGRLVLKHLQLLSRWNRFGGAPDSLGLGPDGLVGAIDFSNVGLMGHSRGGEGARAAYNLYRDIGSPWPSRIPDPVTFAGIFEIGPVDGQTSRVLNADSTTWNVLLPMCDGDVSNLQGVKPFDRMMRIFSESNPTQKSTYTVWGTNHNFYNTEWQTSDSAGCVGPSNAALFGPANGSVRQRRTGRASLLAFFRGNLFGTGYDPTLNANFNPQFQLPPVVTTNTRVDRGYTDSPDAGITTVFEDFDRPTGTNTYGFPNDASNIMITHGSVPNHDPVQRAGVISWTSPGANRYFQTNWAAAGDSIDISPPIGYKTLDLRVSRQASPLNPVGPTNFSIRLAHDDGTLSGPVQLSSYTDLRGPVGSAVGGLHPILQTARIPLAAFPGADLTRIRSVRLTFDGTATGAIYVANIRLSSLSGSPGAGASEIVDNLEMNNPQNPMGVVYKGVNVISRVQNIPSADVLEDQPAVEIEVTSSEGFPVRNELPVLRIGKQEALLSRYPNDGDTHKLIFTLTPEEFAQTSTGDPVTVQYGRDEPGEIWNAGLLDKRVVDK